MIIQYLGIHFFMTSNQSFSSEASFLLRPLHAALAETSQGRTTMSQKKLIILLQAKCL